MEIDEGLLSKAPSVHFFAFHFSLNLSAVWLYSLFETQKMSPKCILDIKIAF